MTRRTLKLLALAAVAAALPAVARAQAAMEARAPEGGPANPKLILVEEIVRVSIDRQWATTTLRQTWANESGAALEGTCRVQTAAGATVEGFAYWNGEQKIAGAVYEKEAAREVYEEVTGLRKDPGLLEQVGEGAFTFRVFPIAPGERKRVEVRIGQRLARIGDAVEYRMKLGRPDALVELDVEDERPIVEVRSPTHRLTSDPKAERLRLQAAPIGKPAEVALSYRVAEKPWTVGGAVHRDRGQDAYVVVRMSLPARADRGQIAPKDVTLVLDRSGSMDGEPLARAREAAVAVVRRLRPEDRVNVLVFDDRVEALYPRPRALDDAVRAETIAYVERIRSGGGTNLALALERALAAQEADARPDVVLFLTDGQSDAKAVLDVARRDPGDARVFTIGVGSGVQRPLLARLAAVKRGRFTFIESAEAMVARVARLYQQLDEPLLVGVAVETQGPRVERTYPRTLPDLGAGDELVWTARVAGSGPLEVAVRGTVGGRSAVHRATVEVPAHATRPWVGRLWARARVDDLLEEIALAGETEELKTEATDLALAYDFVTPYTSFLAIPESEVTDGARVRLESARERKRRVLDKNPDAAALSRSAMPPGDPVLTVRAPRDARLVTAYFPFGLVKELAWDDHAEAWKTRFLVPKDVADGTYETKVVIVRADGTVELATARYTVDAAEPDFEAEALPAAGGVALRVTAAEPARRVVVALVADPGHRVELIDAGDGRTFTGWLPLPAGAFELRVVVADEARNEADDTLCAEVR